ncbi:MAG: VOC family protein [Candidatus Azobacteroides sp.]|nr:VOC family protein [Candidatus Azobacteroides sp.]
MKIEHIAIWTKDLERLRDYYVRFFNGKSNQKYLNPKTQFESYFISFESGCRLELTTIPELEERSNNKLNYKGIAHFAFEVKSKLEVDAKAKELKNAGFPIVKGPRITGDGYYEFETIDIDGNRIEVMAKNPFCNQAM